MSTFRNAILVILIIVFSTGIYAQTDENIYQGYNFHLLLPGARAQSMGGAFTALADDPTAVFYNPAGLARIDKFTIMLDINQSTWQSLRPQTSDSYMTKTLTDFGEDIFAPSCFSVIYPLGNLTVGFAIENFINYSESFLLDARELPSAAGYLSPFRGSLAMNGYNFNGVIAINATDFLSIGMSMGISLLTLDTSSKWYNTNLNDLSDISSIAATSKIDEATTAVNFTVGILLSPSESFSLGASIKYNPPYEFLNYLYLNGDTLNGFLYNTRNITLDVPDRIALGILYKPIKRLNLTADIVFVQYSQLADVMKAVRDIDELGIERMDNVSSLYSAENGTEFHFGFELLLGSDKYPFAIRGGLYSNPLHMIEYTGTNEQIIYSWNIDEFFDPYEDYDLIYTAGLGFTLSSTLKVDIAYITSELYTQIGLSLSLIP